MQTRETAETVCEACAEKFNGRPHENHIATMSVGRCDACGTADAVVCEAPNMSIEPAPGEHPIFASECGHDYEVHVSFGDLGVRVWCLDENCKRSEFPALSSDQARDLAARLAYAANQLDRY